MSTVLVPVDFDDTDMVCYSMPPRASCMSSSSGRATTDSARVRGWWEWGDVGGSWIAYPWRVRSKGVFWTTWSSCSMVSATGTRRERTVAGALVYREKARGKLLEGRVGGSGDRTCVFRATLLPHGAEE